MIYLFYPNDDSIKFLDSLLDTFAEEIHNGRICLIRCEASLKSYQICKDSLKNIPENSTVVFIGHGTPDCLYGGAKGEFLKQPLFSVEDMRYLINRRAIFMSCYSEKLLKKSRRQRKHSECIGFGLLPSDLEETVGKKYLEKLNLTMNEIEKFQNCLVDVFAKLISLLLNDDLNTVQVVDGVKLFINMRVNKEILIHKNIKLANLLYYFYNEMHFD